MAEVVAEVGGCYDPPDGDAGAAEGYVAGPTTWQKVIHGESGLLRERYVRWLIAHGREKKAIQYAMCGMGDEVYETTPGVARVRPRRCGDRFCPRCSRYRGLQFVRQVIRHLKGAGHGAIYHVVLTQRVRPRETLMGTRERFEDKWRRVWRLLASRGFVAGLRTTHVNWSRNGGWHLHVHLVAEFLGSDCDRSRDVQELIEWWEGQVRAEGGGPSAEMFSRLVSDKGPAMGEVEAEQAEFWDEPGDPMERALAYVIRDVCQGVESWNLASAGDEVEELFGGVAGAKMHRLLGEWRRNPEDRFGLTESEMAEKAPPPRDSDVVEGEMLLGTVDHVLYDAMAGIEYAREVLGWLMKAVKNTSSVAARMRAAFGPIAK